MNAALRWLASLGWRHRPAAEVARWRGGPNDVLLRPRLIQALQAHRFDYRGERYPLSPGGIDQVVREVEGLSLADGLLAANERFYRLLTLGVTVTEFMPDGKKHQPTVPLVDWQTPDTNQWDAVESPELHTTIGAHPRRPGVLGYVNGLPLVVVECKKGSEICANPMQEAFVQLQRYMRRRAETEAAGLKEGEPRLFHSNLMVVRSCGLEADYGTITSEEEHFYGWKTLYPQDDATLAGLNAQQQLVAGMLTHSNLLQILRTSAVCMDTDGGPRVKVVCRYQQFRAACKVVERLRSGQTALERSGVDFSTNDLVEVAQWGISIKQVLIEKKLF